MKNDRGEQKRIVMVVTPEMSGCEEAIKSKVAFSSNQEFNVWLQRGNRLVDIDGEVVGSFDELHDGQTYTLTSGEVLARHIQQAEDMVIELEGGRGLQNRLHEEGMTPIHCHNNFVVANVQGGKLDVFEIDFLAHCGDGTSLPMESIPPALANAVFVLFAKRTIMGDRNGLVKRFDELDRLLANNIDGWRRILARPDDYRVRKPSGLTLSHFLTTKRIVPVLCSKYFSDDGMQLAIERKYVPLAVTGSRYVPNGGGSLWKGRLVDLAVKCLRQL